jgi:hypothetical protein
MAVVDQLMVFFWIFFCRVADERSDVSVKRSFSVFRVTDIAFYKDQQDALFSKFISNIYPLHVSSRVTVHHQEEVRAICSVCMVFTVHLW